MFSAESISMTILHFVVPGALILVMLVCIMVLWSDKQLRTLAKMKCPANQGCFGMYAQYKVGVTNWWHMNYGWTKDIFEEHVTYLVHVHRITPKRKSYQYLIIFPDQKVALLRRSVFEHCFTVEKMWPLNNLVQYEQKGEE